MFLIQVLLVGGLFAQFRDIGRSRYIVDPAGSRLLPAVQMAINRVNNKTDGIFDELLPGTKVQCIECFAS